MKENSSFNTVRLRAEVIDESNQDHVLKLYANPENVKLLQGVDAKQDILLSIECSKIYKGIGAYLIFEKHSNVFVGVGGVQKQEPMSDGPLAMPEHDLEFLIILSHEFKGKGYAAEFCDAFFRKIFINFPDLEIPARTNKENIACIKLLKKFGFQEVGETFYHNYNNRFSLLKNNFNSWSANLG